MDKHTGYTLREIPEDVWKQFKIRLIEQGTNIRASLLDHAREVAAGRRRAVSRPQD